MQNRGACSQKQHWRKRNRTDERILSREYGCKCCQIHREICKKNKIPGIQTQQESEEMDAKSTDMETGEWFVWMKNMNN